MTGFVRRAVCAAAIIFAISLQIQPTISIAGANIRVSLSDGAILLFLPLFAWLLYRLWPLLRCEAGPLWPSVAVAASIVMAAGFANGIDTLGRTGPWALTKFAGWFVLLAYISAGCLLARAMPGIVMRLFVRGYVIALGLTVLAFMVLAGVGVSWPFGQLGPRLSGLATNPNAFALAALCGVVLMLSFRDSLDEKLGRFGWEAATALVLAGVLFSRSVAVLLAVAIMWLVYISIRKGLGSAFRISLLALLIYGTPAAVFAALSYFSPGMAFGDDTSSIFSKAGRYYTGGEDVSIAARIRSNYRALDLWASRPVLGAGLGVFLARERERGEPEADLTQIHNTALWIMTEFGLAGLGIFGTAFICLLIFFYRSEKWLRGRDPPAAAAALTGLLVMAGWFAMSIAHELMYQRVPWFILGLCMGVIFAARKNRQTAAKAD